MLVLRQLSAIVLTLTKGMNATPRHLSSVTGDFTFFVTDSHFEAISTRMSVSSSVKLQEMDAKKKYYWTPKTVSYAPLHGKKC